MSARALDQTAIFGRAAERSREALRSAEDAAAAYVEEVRSGSRSMDTACVTCERGPPLEDNHVAGRRHGDLTVPMCRGMCHPRFTESQDLWDPRWQSEERTPALDESLLLRGLVDLLLLRAEHVSKRDAGAYIALAETLREQYAVAGRKTL